jgi:hypothetical protein
MLTRFAYGHVDEESSVSVPWFIDSGFMLIISGVLFMAVLSFMGLLILTGGRQEDVSTTYPAFTHIPAVCSNCGRSLKLDGPLR